MTGRQVGDAAGFLDGSPGLKIYLIIDLTSLLKVVLIYKCFMMMIISLTSLASLFPVCGRVTGPVAYVPLPSKMGCSLEFLQQLVEDSKKMMDRANVPVNWVPQ